MATNNTPFRNDSVKSKHRQEYRNPGRPIMSRKDRHHLDLVTVLNPSQWTPGCLVCCNAPACCPLLSCCPCCGDAEYITVRRRASAYVYIRENSVEWNDPKIVMQSGVCCGVDPCLYDVQDHIQV